MYQNKKVLLVEDNEINRMMATLVLKEVGIEPEEAKDGEEALLKILSRGAGYYDLVLMDIVMPQMDGITATKRIRELKVKGMDKLPIVAMTVETHPEELIKYERSGMNDYIEKPMDLDELKIILSRYFG